MPVSAITPNQWTILERMESGPCWMRSFHTVKPLVEDLVQRGLIERCRPHLGAARNMVRLTDAGCASMGIAVGSVPSIRPIIAAPEVTVILGKIHDVVPARVRRICEAFIRAIEGGETKGAAVAQLAAQHDVQRPAIWKTLRAGGVVPPYKARDEGGQGRPIGGGTPGYTTKRRERALAVAEQRSQPNIVFVDRDPCKLCGVRGDLGCAHNRVAA